MFRLAVNCPNKYDGTSIYRAWGVLPSIKDGIFLDKVEGPFDWAEMNNCDALFSQRPVSTEQISIIHRAKQYKKPIWIDYDDDLLGVPPDNQTYSMYSQPQALQNVQSALTMADVVTVSTEQLKRKYSTFSKNIIVIPNAIDLDLVDRVDPAIERNKLIIWRGSACHHRDLREYESIILEIYFKYKDWSWVFMGHNPWAITHQMTPDRFRHIPWAGDYVTYMEMLKRMHAAVAIVPLHDYEFNHSKSRIAHLESAMAGSAVLAPDWPEWQGGNINHYKSKPDFKRLLSRMLETPLPKLAEMANADYEWIRANRSLKVVNKLRKGIITQLQGGL